MFVEGAEPGEADNEPLSDSSTEGSDDEEDVEYDAAEKAQDEVLDRWSGGYDETALDQVVFFRRSMSRVIHVTVDETGMIFRCGREVSGAYLKVDRPKILHPVCKQCFSKLVVKRP